MLVKPAQTFGVHWGIDGSVPPPPPTRTQMTIALPATHHPPDTWQQAVITSDASSIRVLAPAGSGKTETLARRAGHQIQQGIFPHRILILTFDTQARTSFQRALQRLDVSGNVEIRTLNAFGLRVLASMFPEERSRTAQVFHGSAEPLLKSLTESTEGGMLVELFGTLKSHLFDPRQVNKRALTRWVEKHYSRLVPERFLKDHPDEAKAFAQQLAREFVRYEESLQARNIIDFEDQKLRTYALLEANPGAADRVRSRYDEVIVDEVQDINPLDQKLIELIARDANLVITGDDDQAIYGFRWASADYLIRPEKPFDREFVSYELRTNYRCPRTILARSSQLIKHNRNRVAKQPESGVDAPGTVILSPADDQLAGSRLLVEHLRETIATHDELGWSDIAILARRNQHLDEMQVQLITAGIPHVVKSGRDLIRTWTTALNLLDLSTAIRDTGITRHTGFVPAIAAYTWFPRHVREDAGRLAGLPLDTVLAELAALGITPAVQKRFQDALALLAKQRTVAQELTVIESRFLGIDASDRRNRASEDTDDDRAQDLPLELLRTILSKGDSSRAQAIDRLRGFIERAGNTNQQQGAKVELATYHGAKGRQWHTVVLPWVSNGTSPDPLTRPEFGELEAERRLFYVAMTRAADTLVIGHPSTNAKATPSRFLFEAGLLEEVPLVTPAPTTPTGTRTRTRSSRPAPQAGPDKAASPLTKAGPNPARQRKRSTTTAYADIAGIESILQQIRADGGVDIAYPESPELLYPLQLALLLEGIPYRAPANHDLLHSWILRELYRHITHKRLRIIKPVEEPEYPGYARAYPALVAWLRHKGLDMPTARAELDAAIDAALAGRRRKSVATVTFHQTNQH